MPVRGACAGGHEDLFHLARSLCDWKQYYDISGIVFETYRGGSKNIIEYLRTIDDNNITAEITGAVYGGRWKSVSNIISSLPIVLQGTIVDSCLRHAYRKNRLDVITELEPLFVLKNS